MSSKPPSSQSRPFDEAITQHPQGFSHDGSAARPPASRMSIYCAKLPNSTVNSFCGAAAGVASGIVTCPLDVIKTRLQAQGSFRRNMTGRFPSPALYSGMVGTAKTIWQQDGIRGMYRGLGPMLLGYLPTWAVYMTVYDASREYYSTQVG
jgi:solute carrier family 25 (mitochondrial folate transporter), member 32